jgi:hypothetical protein
VSAFALCTYKPHRLVHNGIGTATALTALPLLWSCMSVLSSSAARGELERPECRQLALGVAAASVWAAVTVVWAPAFTSAVVRTLDPVVFPLPLRAAAAAIHLGTAAACLAAWRRVGGTATTLVHGVCGALWRLGPSPSPSSSSVQAAWAGVLATASTAFGGFACLSIFAPFPLATVPSLLGKRHARAFGGWLWLAAVCLHTLKEGGLPRAASRTLRHGLRRMCVWHLLLLGARPVLESASVYPAAMACLPAMAASVAVYALTTWAVASDEDEEVAGGA